MTDMIELPQGVLRQGNKIIKVTQEAIDNYAFLEIIGDATEIGESAFEGLNMSRYKRHTRSFLITDRKLQPGKYLPQFSPTIDIKYDIYIPSFITKINDKAFANVKGIEIIKIGSRQYKRHGVSCYYAGCRSIGDNAFENMNLKMVCFGPKLQEIRFGENVFAGNNFTNQFNIYSQTFNKSLQGISGISSLNVQEVIAPTLTAEVETIPIHLSGTQSNNNPNPSCGEPEKIPYL